MMAATTPHYSGFFQLRDAHDLREKARADMQALEAEPTNAGIAFNFFVTARHVPDWNHTPEAFRSNPILRICRNLGDGAKHFAPDAGRNTQVRALSEVDGAFDPATFDSSYDTGCLVVTLDPKDAAEAALPVTVDVVTLARRIMLELDALFPGRPL